jgi:ADP-ribose pyrophosphatase YjhB (NUDIX family)
MNRRGGGWRSWLAGTPLPGLAYGLKRLGQRITRPLSVGVKALVVDGEGRVLLVRHSYIGGWHLPGGRVNHGETAAAAAVRELQEETGLSADAVPRNLLGLYGRFGHGGSDHVAVYLVTAWTGTLRADGLEVAEAKFFATDALPAATTAPTRRRIAEYRGLTATAAIW